MDHAKNRADGGAFLSNMNEGESPRQILNCWLPSNSFTKPFTKQAKTNNRQKAKPEKLARIMYTN